MGLHYLLVHYDVPLVEASAWRLEVSGAVEQPLTLSLDDLRERPSIDLTATMECARPRPARAAAVEPTVAHGGRDCALARVLLAALLEEARPRTDAVDVVFGGLDRGVEGGSSSTSGACPSPRRSTPAGCWPSR